MKISAVDLFCGVGGLTYGLKRGGIPVAAGIDIDRSCQYPYEANNDADFVAQDATTLTAASLRKLFGRADYRVLVGCAPCQPFSSYSHGLSIKRDDRWSLLDAFGKLISEVKPERREHGECDRAREPTDLPEIPKYASSDWLSSERAPGAVRRLWCPANSAALGDLGVPSW